MRWRFGLLFGSFGCAVLIGITWFLAPSFLQVPTLVSSSPDINDALPLEGPSEGTPRSSTPLTPAESVRRKLNRRYRLRPDRRLTDAFDHVYRFLTGESSSSVSARFKSQQWEIVYRGQVIGYLDEFPRFGSTLSLLTEFARVIEERTDRFNESGSPPELPHDPRSDFFHPSMREDLRTLDRHWMNGQKSRAMTAMAARRLGALYMQSFDAVEVEDRLASHALAMLAVAQASNNRTLHGVEARLAYFMGYSTHAVKVSRHLPDSDPFPSFIERRDDSLRDRATRDKAPIETRYLWLLRLQERDRREQWFQWTRSRLSQESGLLPILKSGIKMGGFDASRDFSRILPLLSMMEMVPEDELNESLRRFRSLGMALLTNPETRPQARVFSSIMSQYTGKLIPRFHNVLKRHTEGSDGPFYPGPIRQSLFRGYFYSGVYKTADHYMNRYNSVETTQKYAALVGHADTGVAGDLQTWLNHMAMSMAGRVKSNTLRNDLSGLGHLGAPPLYQIFKRAMDLEETLTPAVLRATKDMFRRLDTRPDHLKDAGYIMKTQLYDRRMMEHLYRIVLDRDPSRRDFLRTWWAGLHGDTEAMLNDFESPHLNRDARSNLISMLGDHEHGPDPEPMYKRLIEQDPSDWSIYDEYIDWLMEANRYRRAEELAREWIQQSDETHGFDYRNAHVRISESLRAQGTPGVAWSVIQPHLDSMMGSVLAEGVQCLMELGELDRAKHLARREFERYPDNLSALRRLVTVLWRQEKYKRAARLLTSWNHSIQLGDWRWRIGSDFGDVFEQDREGARKAFRALKQNGVKSWALLHLLRELPSRKAYGIAFRLMNQLSGMKGMKFLIQRVDMYGVMKKWKGPGRALEWLRTSIPRRFMAASSMVFYDMEQFELLWSLIPNPDELRYTSSIWLYRTAAALEKPELMKKHGQPLRDYYRGPGSSGHYNTIGRVLMEMDNKQTAMDLIESQKKRCEVAYFLGLLAAKNGNLAEANDWFRTSLETGLKNNGEYHWSRSALIQWNNHFLSLERMAREVPLDDLI